MTAAIAQAYADVRTSRETLITRLVVLGIDADIAAQAAYRLVFDLARGAVEFLGFQCDDCGNPELVFVDTTTRPDRPTFRYELGCHCIELELPTIS